MSTMGLGAFMNAKGEVAQIELVMARLGPNHQGVVEEQPGDWLIQRMGAKFEETFYWSFFKK
jgi:hypothetical protein